MSLAIVSLLALAGQYVSALELGQNCLNPVGAAGKCVLFRECQPLINIYNKPVNTPDDMQFLMSSRSGTFERKTLMCCAGLQSLGKTTLPEYPNCGIQLSDRIIGGQQTKIDEFPWTALIEYQKLDGRIDFHCAGTIINERYIVTAAHCVRWNRPHRVRLGEWDLGSSIDCEDDYCSDAPIDLDIEKIVVHPGFSGWRKKNDIALIRVNREIKYSETVRPICLALTDALRNRKHAGISSTVAGWGRTETDSGSEKKLKVEINVVDLKSCATIYERENSTVLLDSTQMCAGGIRQQNACRGDSGGPLMRQISGVWYLIGVASFGASCDRVGIPSVYTNVAEYVDWIRDNIY